MTEQKSGRIINLSSVSALGNIGQVNYAPSKAVVIGMTRALAFELARHGNTVNAITPGFFEPVLTQQIPAEVKDNLVARVPLKRIGHPDEIAAPVASLVSEKASSTTEKIFFIDGGLSIGLSAF